MIIKKIEKLRISANMRKTVIAKHAGISVAMYYNYLNGSAIPYDVAQRLIEALGFKLIIVTEM